MDSSNKNQELTEEHIKSACTNLKKLLVSTAGYIVDDYELGKDIVQVVFLSLILRVRDNNKESVMVKSVDKYIISCVRNAAYKVQKANKYDHVRLQDIDFERPFYDPIFNSNSDWSGLETSESINAETENGVLLREALNAINLSDEDDAIFTAYMAGSKNEYISFKLKIPIRKVTIRIYNIKKRIKNYVLKNGRK